MFLLFSLQLSKESGILTKLLFGSKPELMEPFHYPAPNQDQLQLYCNTIIKNLPKETPAKTPPELPIQMAALTKH